MSPDLNTCPQGSKCGFPRRLLKPHFLREGSSLVPIKLNVNENFRLIFYSWLVNKLASLCNTEFIRYLSGCQSHCSQKKPQGGRNRKLFIWLLSGSVVSGTIALGVGGATDVLARSVDSLPEGLSATSLAEERTKKLPCSANRKLPDSGGIVSAGVKSLAISGDSCDRTLESFSVVSPLLPPLLRDIELPKTSENLPSSISISQAQQIDQKQAQQQQPKPSPSTEEESASPEQEVDPDLGRLRLRQRRVPPRQPQPVLHIIPRISYFYTTNVFSGVDPVEDSLYFPSLTLWSTPKLGLSTYLIASVDGNLIRYLNESQYDYNLLRFRTGIYQRFNSRMGGEIGWNNQQYFRATNGDRFLDEHFIYLSLSRRDWLNRRLALDSFYDARLSFANPDNRSRLINYLSLSLSYYFQRNLQVGMDYQFSFSDFTKDDREDYYHRLLGRLSYGVSTDSQINLQGGVSVGGSTDPNIDFDSLFFSVTYSLDLKVF